MRFSEIKTLDNYEIVHLVTIEPTIIIAAEEWTLADGFYRCPLEGYATRFFQNDVEFTGWMFDETTKEIVIDAGVLNPTAAVAVCAVRFHFSSKPCVIGRHLEETPMTIYNGNVTDLDPGRIGVGAFAASSDLTALSTFFGRNLTYREVYFLDYDYLLYYVIPEGVGSRWFLAAEWTTYLSTGAVTTSKFMGWPIPFLPIVSGVSAVAQTVDSENRHIPYQSSGEITLYNDKEFFIPKITKYTWHQAKMSIYWWALESEAIDPELLYQGRCTNMRYSKDVVSIEFSTDLITADNFHKSAVSGFENLQERFFSIPSISVPLSVQAKIARTPYGRLNDFTVQGVNMDTEQGERDGTAIGTASALITSSKSHLLSTVFPGDSVIFPNGSTATIRDHGKMSYGIDESAVYSFSNGPAGTLRIYCATANFYAITQGSIVVLSANPSFNLGVGYVYGIEAADAIYVALDWVPGYASASNVRMDPETLTFWRANFAYAQLQATLPTVTATTSAGIIHSTPKHHNNKRFLLSPIEIGIQTIYCSDNIGSAVLGDIMVVTDTWGLYAGDLITMTFSGLRTIVAVDHVAKTVQLSGWQNVVTYASFYRHIVQSAFFVGQSGAPIAIPFGSFTLTNDGGRSYLTLDSSLREIVLFGDIINVRVHRCVVVDDTWLGDNSSPGKFVKVQVGDSLIISGIEVIVSERINDYALVAYPMKDIYNFATIAAQWEAFNDTYIAEHRRYRPFDNNTRVFVNCYGIYDHNGSWIQTPEQVLGHTLKNIASFVPDVLVNTPQIEAMDTTYPLVSFSIPRNFDATEPDKYKDTINEMCAMSHSVVYSEFISSGATKFARLTARRLFEQPTLKYLSDVDVVREPEITINFRGGPSQLSVRYRVGDTSSLENNDIDWNSFYLGNKDKSERDLWLYYTGDVQAWLENELLVNTGPRIILTVECSPGSAPDYGDRVRCDFRNNPETIRSGLPSRYIQGFVLGRIHGANGTVQIELDNLSGLSDK